MTKLRFILFPLSILYIFVTEVRNFFFRINVLKSKQYSLPIINVGNLTVGGTGKTPMVLWLAKVFHQANLNVAIVSRGYGRKTKGFYWVEENSSAKNAGDEPLLFKQNNSSYIVAVSEKRTDAIDKIVNEKNVDVIILDDAYQHQYVKPSFNILLSDYSRQFYNDFVLPAGNLRELRKNKSRSDVIISTKCPKDLPESEKNQITQKINLEKHQQLFFSSLNYTSLNSVFTNENLDLSSLKEKSTLLITGIANANPLKIKLKELCKEVSHMEYSDHHAYSKHDIQEIEKISKLYSYVLTTSKDAVKLKSFSELKNVPLYALNIEPTFDQEEKLKGLVINHVKEYKRNS